MPADTTLRRLHTSLLLYQYPLVASQLLDICGDVDHIYAYLEAKKISEVKLPSELKKVLKVNHRSRNQDHLNHIIAWLNLPDRTFICLDSADYPTQLAEISDPPLVLYAHGNLELLKQPQLAIVGSRNPTQYGRAVTRLFAEEIGKSGLVVTSGMARGIDSAAHRGTLGVGGNTIAVLGTGCDHVYPPENQTLMHEIASSGL